MGRVSEYCCSRHSRYGLGSHRKLSSPTHREVARRGASQKLPVESASKSSAEEAVRRGRIKNRPLRAWKPSVEDASEAARRGCIGRRPSRAHRKSPSNRRIAASVAVTESSGSHVRSRRASDSESTEVIDDPQVNESTDDSASDSESTKQTDISKLTHETDRKLPEWACYGHDDCWRRGGTTPVCYSHCYAMDYSDSNMGVCRNIVALVIVGTVWV